MACTDRNPLVREGTSLLNRVLASLSANSARVDERDTADLILFAKRYSNYLNYYDDTNVLTGDWHDLMRMDVSVTLALLSRINTTQAKDYKRLLFKRIKLAANDADARKEFKFLFDLLFSLVKLVDDQFKFIVDEFEYRGILQDVIRGKLRSPLANLLICFQNFKTALLLDYSLTEFDSDAPIEVQSDGAFTAAVLSPEWAFVGDILITVPALATDKEKIVYLIRHNVFVSQIDTLLNGIATLVDKAAILFQKTLTDFPRHSPHYALFIAFIRVFSREQDALNTYTKRHLDFYYKDVLRLTNKVPETDTAHVLFELQKPVTTHRLQKETLFKGGKDTVTGKEINYALSDDVVLNKAVVSRLHSTQIVRGSRDLLKASPTANSDDGQEAKLTSVDQSWFTFGDVKKIKNASSGFAVVSNILYLAEGFRTITTTVEFATPFAELFSFNVNCFKARYTGKKKWIEVPASQLSAGTDGARIELKLTLSPDDPAIVPYDEAVHLQALEAVMPVLEFFLDQNVANALPYTLLCKKKLQRLTTTVKVVGVKDLVLSNDGGAIDASKPFKPFGDFPSFGTGFYIGSREIFQKHLSELEIRTGWKSASPNLNSVVRYLRQGIWGVDNFSMIRTTLTDTINFSGGNIFTPSAISFEKNDKLSVSTLEGFLQIRLNESQYSLSSHMQRISDALSLGTKVTLASTSPQSYAVKVAAAPVPKEIVLDSFSIDYTATSEIDLIGDVLGNNNFLLHLCPFGYEKVKSILDDSSSDAEVKTTVSLLQDISNEGELYVGIENALARQVVNILFNVAEGSSNPLRTIQNLNWYYLSSGNNWRLFHEEDLIDRTNNLSQAGIVTITLPRDISNENTLLGKGLYWIKVTVRQYTDAVCKMILIQAQAAKVVLVQDDSNLTEFRKHIPAKTIGKFLISDGAVKKIDQPFDSFSGRTRETDDHFYVRVSERLRHKQRGIAIWDYEHIVLEKFQTIFKVKCLNHSGFYTVASAEVFCENFPGHVTIVTVPNLINASNINPLRPYTSAGLLKNIEDYLKGIISPFVVLQVRNPQFEEVQVDFKVKFYDHLSEDFYLNLLNTEIERFLSPWAYDAKTEITFGGKIHKSALVNFVEERPYVDYVTCFRMNQFIRADGGVVNVLSDVEEAVASTSRSILVSYFDEDTNTRHIINSTPSCAC